MLTVKAFEKELSYQFDVTDGTEVNIFTYDFGKEPPHQGQTKTEYLQGCKREAQLLAEDEIARKAPPTELVI